MSILVSFILGVPAIMELLDYGHYIVLCGDEKGASSILWFLYKTVHKNLQACHCSLSDSVCQNLVRRGRLLSISQCLSFSCKRVLVVYFDSYTKLSTKSGRHVQCSLSYSVCQTLDRDVCSPFFGVCFLDVHLLNCVGNLVFYFKPF